MRSGRNCYKRKHIVSPLFGYVRTARIDRPLLVTVLKLEAVSFVDEVRANESSGR